MGPLLNTPQSFAAEMLAGFVDAHRDRVRAVPGGVVRATPSAAGKVAVVTGGGAGHFPAFVGLVGHGMADGAVPGDVFAAPSADQVVRVARAAHHGGGVLLAFGNYAGDVLNFGMAAQRLRELGIDTRLVPVTDDIASAPIGSEDQRRGIAGGLVVYKMAGAGAESGADLDEVWRIARRANERTRSIGVAFSGCTLPGAREPLFELPEGTMAIGMGVHGEPGISTAPVTSADDLADLLVDQVLREAPTGADGRVCAILNGLGATKYEELFVLWRRIGQRLAQAGATVVRPEVGELTTSLDMAGCSLTLCWLDDELARLWLAPADSPAYRAGRCAAPDGATRAADRAPEEPGEPGVAALEPPQATAASRWAARRAVAAFDAIAAAVGDQEDRLGRLDAVAGDGDHGRGMTRGATAARDAARDAVRAHAGLRTTLIAAAAAWADRAGGTSGALWGAGLRAFGSEVDDRALPDSADVARAARAALAEIQALGGAVPGDKTMVDALHAFAAAVSDAADEDEPFSDAWRAGARAATERAAATAAMTPRKGRARPLAARSKGNPDPGAVSLAICLNACADALGHSA